MNLSSRTLYTTLKEVTEMWFKEQQDLQAEIAKYFAATSKQISALKGG